MLSEAVASRLQHGAGWIWMFTRLANENAGSRTAASVRALGCALASRRCGIVVI